MFKNVICYCLLSLFVSSTAFASQEDLQQALEQLRMLQKKLSSADDDKPSEDSSIPAPPSVNNQVVPAPVASITPEEIEKRAFERTIKSAFPLNPTQIIKMKQLYKSDEYAKSSPIDTPPKPVATSQIVNLSPGSTPPAIRLARGFVSSLVFLDSQGSPWPIASYDLGDPESFNIQWDKVSNTLMIQSMKMYHYGNLAIRLQGLNTPVMLTLIPGQRVVDYRVDLRIQKFGPNSKNIPTSIGLPPDADDILLHILDGVAPVNSKRLNIIGGPARAWVYKNKMFVRTNLTILSPGWIATMKSADGMNAYKMPVSPVLLVSWHGKVMQLKVEGL